jgi:hypothetical protein
MSEEQFEPISEEEAQRRIQAAFLTLDAIYNLHGPKDTQAEVWDCKHCDVPWPCQTEEMILIGLGLANEPAEATEEQA